jgi:hypothetical protein
LLTGVRVPAAWRPTGLAIRGTALASPIDLSGEDVTDVTLTFTNQVSGLTGAVQTQGRALAANPEIIVFPADRQLWAEDPLEPRQPRLEQSLNDGRYRIADLAATIRGGSRAADAGSSTRRFSKPWRSSPHP